MTYSYKPKKSNSSQMSGNQESSIVFVLEKSRENKIFAKKQMQI